MNIENDEVMKLCYRFVPNLPATDYESNLKVISSVQTVQVNFINLKWCEYTKVVLLSI